MELQTNVKSGEVKITEGQAVAAEKKPEPDLITRVSQFKKEESSETTEAKPEEKTESKETFGLTQEDFEKVQNDPVLSKYYKSMQADYTKKTQVAASERKEAEKIRAEFSTWTPERIQQLLNDQNFVSAAQQVMKSQAPSTYEGTQEEWSALSDTDKAKFQNMEKEIQILKQQNLVTRMRQEDETLKTKYSNYNPQAVDIITAEWLQGRRIATREDVWKVYDYEGAIERAYSLGIQDGKSGVREKVASSSMEGTMATMNKEPLKKEEGESDRNYFRRIFLNNLAKQKEASVKK